LNAQKLIGFFGFYFDESYINATINLISNLPALKMIQILNV